MTGYGDEYLVQGRQEIVETGADNKNLHQKRCENGCTKFTCENPPLQLTLKNQKWYDVVPFWKKINIVGCCSYEGKS